MPRAPITTPTDRARWRNADETYCLHNELSYAMKRVWDRWGYPDGLSSRVPEHMAAHWDALYAQLIECQEGARDWSEGPELMRRLIRGLELMELECGESPEA